MQQVLWKMAKDEKPFATRDWVDNWLTQYESNKKIKLDKEQREAVQLAVKYRTVAVTGGPGTGKTAVIDAIDQSFKNWNKKIS